jgi:hypothetical protein
MITRPVDGILEGLNRLNEAKLTGALKEDEFSNLIRNIGDLCANRIAQGKLNPNDIESLECYMGCFIGPERKNYFEFEHINLDLAAKSFLESLAAAEAKFEQRMSSARPVSGGHALGLRRIN